MAFLNFPARGDRYEPGASVQVRSGVSVVAILCAIASFVMSAQLHQVVGLLLALVAIGAGLMGGVRALSPRVSGGMISLAAVALGAIAILFALVRMIICGRATGLASASLEGSMRSQFKMVG